MDTSSLPPSISPEQHSDRRRNILFVLAVLAAAFLVLTVISVEKLKRYVEEQGGDVEFEYSYGDDGLGSVAFDVALEDDDAGETDDEKLSVEPLVIPEYIGYGGVPSPDVDETWLSNEMRVWWDVNPEGLCASLTPYVSQNDVAPYYGYPTGVSLQEKDVQGVLFDYLGVNEDVRKYASTALASAVSEDALVMGVCAGANTGVFLKTMEAEGRIAVVYSMYVNEDGMFRIVPYQPVAGLMDGYEFIPDTGRGYALIGTGYGDAGFISWKYYKLNPELMTTELIESCAGGPEFDENYVELGWSLECELEYSPS